MTGSFPTSGRTKKGAPWCRSEAVGLLVQGPHLGHAQLGYNPLSRRARGELASAVCPLRQGYSAVRHYLSWWALRQALREIHDAIEAGDWEAAEDSLLELLSDVAWLDDHDEPPA